MNKEFDKKALRRWERSDIPYKNYFKYIKSKDVKFSLTIIDLFYVKNFKGGAATFSESEKLINEKLIEYSKSLKEIESKFFGKSLKELSDSELKNLKEKANDAIKLVESKSDYKIKGLGVSFLTTLLHFYFPDLLPILDRRVLSGAGLLTKKDIDSQLQVKKIERFYSRLIDKFKGKDIRDYDKELFIKPFFTKKVVNRTL